MSYELAIIGAGNMGEAIARGILSAELLSAEQIIAADPTPKRRDLFTTQLGIQCSEENGYAASQAKTILLSVKPQMMPKALEDIRPVARKDVLVISIAAGISTAYIEAGLGSHRAWRVVRAMPNTPMLVKQGMVAVAAGKHATVADVDLATSLFQAAAKVIEVPEEKIDAVTAVSGTGPAYIYYIVEHMIRAGVELGLTPHEAYTLTVHTALGAAKLLIESTDSPQELRRKVTTPNGTTQAAIETMEAKGVPDAIVSAIHRAAQRSKELGK